jgi:endonuclease/exonuclease/phosphatase family metal-dependent hydrolase
VAFNTHLDVHGPIARELGARLIRQYAATLNLSSRLIVLGDFNSLPGSAAHRTLLYGSNGDADPWCDTYLQLHSGRSGSQSGTTHGFTGQRDRGRIDWILVSSSITAIESEIDHAQEHGRYPSDHFPVTALLRLEK